MTRNEIKQISIREYLGRMNIQPVKDYGYYGMYHCPYREDRNASFKVDFRQNLWHDFGTNEGGSIIDLLMKLNKCSMLKAVTEANKYFSTSVNQHDSTTIRQMDNFSFHRNNSFEDKSAITIQYIIPITHPKLIEWVDQRKIDLALAKQYCKEVHYENQSGQFFSVGFRNDRGGYELSSPTGFKGCYSPKDVKTYRNDSNSCLVFEGFWDFLSCLMLKKVSRTQRDVAVLNSVANISKAMDFIKAHKDIYTYLDNDEGGRKATELIKNTCSTVYDRSVQYTEYKDLNDFLRKKPMAKPEVRKKSFGLKR